MAGDRAVNLDLTRAESLYRRALELLPDQDPERAHVLFKAARAAVFAGDFTEAEKDFTEAIGVFRALGDGRHQGEALAELSALFVLRGDTDQADAASTEAVQILQDHPEWPELARAEIRRGARAMMAGKHELALESVERGLKLAERHGLADVVARGLNIRGACKADLGDMTGIEDLREGLRLSLELGQAREATVAYINLGDAIWFAEGPGAGLENHRTGMQFADRRGQISGAMWLRGESVWMLFDAGAWDELLDVAGNVVDWERDRGGTQLTAMVLPYRAQVLARRGDLPQASSIQSEYLELARNVGDPQVLVPALAVAAFTEWRLGDRAGAVALLSELEEAARDKPSLFRSWHLPDAARILEDSGETALTDKLVEDTKTPTSRELNCALTARAVRAEARGAIEEALGLYDGVATSWKDFGFVLERGQALFGAARCLLALGKSEDAIPKLEAARDAFASLEAKFHIDETEAALQRARG
jgi:tetratricopeptide (TPR) repeat protein